MSWPVSAEYLVAVKSSRNLAYRADIYRPGASPIFDVKFESPKLTVDETAEIRTVFEADYIPYAGGPPIPTIASDALTPAGNWLILSVGLYTSVGVELIPAGVFPLAQSIITDDGTVGVHIVANDRSKRVASNRFTSPWSVVDGVNVGKAIADLALDRDPTVVFNPPDFTAVTRFTAPASVFTEEDDPWQKMVDLAANAGLRLFYDRIGRLTLVADPVNADPVDVWAEGGSQLVKIQSTIDSDPGYNAMCVLSEPDNDAPPLKSIVYDDDPASPTYVGSPPGSSPYGLKPAFYRSKLITTQDQCDSAAIAMFNRMTGLSQSYSIDVLPDWSLDPGDLLALRRAALGLDGNAVLSGLAGGLDVGDVTTATFRQLRLTA